MLSPNVHVMIGTVEVNKVEIWAKKPIRFMEAITKSSFQTEVEQAYYNLMELAKIKGFSKWDFEELKNVERFIAKIKQNIAIKFAEEASKEPFLEKSHEEVENETVSSAYWITEQIVKTQEIIEEKIQRKAREIAFMEYRNTQAREKFHGYNDCDCYD